VSIALVLRCDGRRQYIEQSIASLSHIDCDFTYRFIVDDSGDKEYADWLDATFPTFECIHHPERQGMSGGVRTAFATVVRSGVDYAFATEDDMQIVSDVSLSPMIELLESQPHLCQIGLKRLGNEQEMAGGGWVEIQPPLYAEHHAGDLTWIDTDWLFFFSPSLIPRRIMEFALANVSVFLETEIMDALRPQGYRSSFIGGMYDPPLCRHVGYARSSGYRW
jgi:hypothetical protein